MLGSVLGPNPQAQKDWPALCVPHVGAESWSSLDEDGEAYEATGGVLALLGNSQVNSDLRPQSSLSVLLHNCWVMR